MKLTIGFDARTFFYSDSIARGIGHYSLYHLLAIVRKLPEISFILFTESLEPHEPLKPLTDLPNVSIRLIDDYNPSDIDILHICDPMNDLPGFDSPLRIFRNENISVTFYDLIPLNYYFEQWNHDQQKAYTSRLNQMKRSNCRFLAISENSKNELIAHLDIPDNRAIAIMAGLNTVIHKASDTDASIASKVRNKFNITKPFFLHVGAHDPHKNFNNAYHAFANCQTKCELQLVVVGKMSGLLKGNALYAVEKGLNDIIFTGFASREELEVLYSEAVGLLFLSRYEGFGFPVLEAMAQGCPVITTNVTSIPEVAGDAALMFDPDDIGSISSAMEQLVRKPALREDLRRKGYEQASKFTWEKTAEKTIAVWEQMLGRPLSEATNRPQIVWLAPFLNPSGYTSEAFAFAQALLPRFEIELGNISSIESQEFINGLTPELRSIMANHLHDGIDCTGKTVIIHFPAYAFKRPPGAACVIGRTMFETDSLPAGWVGACAEMDEIWVPSVFNRETFIRAGVPPQKLRIVHEPVDTSFFDFDSCQPMPLPGKAAFNFLSMFEWSIRKGWDILLSAYFSEFSRDDDVCLHIKTYLLHTPDGDARDILQQKICDFALSKGLDPEQLPRYELITHQIPFRELPSLYKSIDCFVLPSRGEGWGRPYCEAMSMGLPVIATNWSGNTEFMNDRNSLLIPVDSLVEIDDAEIPFYKGHRWAEPSVDGLRSAMRSVVNNPEKGKLLGSQARKDMEDFYSCEVIGEKLALVLKETGERDPEPTLDPLRIIWQGSQFVYHSLALVNRELCRRLVEAGHELTIIPYEPDEFVPEKGSPFAPLKQCINKPLTQAADVVVRHQWPPDFTPPPAGHWVMIQPWEYGSLPKEWIRPMNEELDEVWVPSNYVRDCYISSGIRADRVFVVPNGVDTELFRPEGAVYPTGSTKSFRFLFVGGTIHRKGIDLLLTAYRESFSSRDDICLVIKDMGGKSFYQGQTAQEMIQRFSADPSAPEILYIDTNLHPDEMAALYRSCHCLVHPYRGEGFGLPIAEAMACGLPVIVTGHGASLDFCPPEAVWFIPAQEVHFDACRVGDIETVAPPWLAEPDLAALKNAMLHASGHPEESRQRGMAARKHICNNFTWDTAVACAGARMHNLRTKPIIRFETHDRTAPSLSYDDSDRSMLISTIINQAETLYRQGEAEKAVTLLIRSGIGAAPEYPAAYYALVEILIQEQRFEDALQVISEMPPSADHLQLEEIKVICHASLGNDESARTSASRVQERPRVKVALGTIRARQGDQTGAEELFRQAIGADPSCSNGWFYLGILLWGQEKHDEAWQAVKRATELDPLNRQAVEILKDMAQRLDEQ